MTAKPRALEALREAMLGRSRLSAQTREVYPVLVNALAIGEVRLLADYARWADSLARARSDPENGAGALFRSLRLEVSRLAGPEVRQYTQRFLDDAETLSQTGTEARGDSEALTPQAERYLELLLAHEDHRAYDLAAAELTHGFDLSHVYQTLLEPALIESGRRWEKARLNVAQEHYVTESTLKVMRSLAAVARRAGQRNRTFLAVCVGEEVHDVGLRMVSYQLDVAGWKTIFLGAAVPIADLEAFLREVRPTVVGVSVALAAHLAQAVEAIAMIRGIDPNIPIVLGGRLFRDGNALWVKLGADGSARNVSEAVEVIERLADDRERRGLTEHVPVCKN